MGVKDLWPILELAKSTISFDELDGSVLAIDLGFWTCQMRSATDSSVSSIHKLHLRNLFFRIIALLKRNITPVFISEGRPPELKHETIRNRLASRSDNKSINVCHSRRNNSLKRSRFDQLLKEAKELIDLMGVFCMDSDGEGEAVCAALNEAGLVDAVVTDDNDAFLYGAKVVLRGFCLDSKTATIERYSSDTIENVVKIDRDQAIALALILGCDYCQKGLPGVGKERALRLLQSWNSRKRSGSILEWLKNWRNIDFPECDPYIKARLESAEDFPNDKIIDEYKRPRKFNRSQRSFQRTRPKLGKLVSFLVEKLEWKPEYVLEKIIAVFARQKIYSQICENPTWNPEFELLRIIKMRVRNGKSCLEVMWSILDDDEWSSTGNYTSVEPEDLFTKAFPNLVEDFHKSISDRKGTKREKPKPKKVDATDPKIDLEDDMAHLNISALVPENTGTPKKPNLLEDSPLAVPFYQRIQNLLKQKQLDQ